jgi:amino acid adenylation domain-containing protein
MKLVIDHLRFASIRVPDQLAVICGEQSLTYAELDSLSSQIAIGLQTLNISAGEPVGLYMPKCIEAVAALYATLKLASCYVPIAIDNPLPRLAHMLDDCGIRFVLTLTTPTPDVAKVLQVRGAKAIVVKDFVNAYGETLVEAIPAQQSAAAILYTSGSTGMPKGAIITHANLAVFSNWAVSAFKLSSKDRLLSHAPFHFDLSFFDLFSAAESAGTVVLPMPSDITSASRIASIVNRFGVTVWQSVPSALTLQTMSGRQAAEIMPTVRCVLFAGERMPEHTLLKMADCFPNASFYNVYGCTETNDTFMYEVPSDVTLAPDPLPIGKPLPYIRYRIVDEAGENVEQGQKGQLLVSGETVMAGYVDVKSKTLSAVPSYNNDHIVDGFYRTKDIVSLGYDGDIHFHGRSDTLIKSNGYRVNLMEIEDHLRLLDGVLEVAVFSIPDELISNLIIANVSLYDGIDYSSLELKLYCAATLPKYAIPHRFQINHEELPKNSTGKIDKLLLAEKWFKGTTSKQSSHESKRHECA